jgi:hypothetical protein
MCAFVFIGRPSHATFARPQHARRNRLKSYLSLLARCPFNWGYKHKLRISSAPIQDPPPQYFDGREDADGEYPDDACYEARVTSITGLYGVSAQVERRTGSDGDFPYPIWWPGRPFFCQVTASGI